MRLYHEPTKGLVLSQERKPQICEQASAAGVTGLLRIILGSFVRRNTGGRMPNTWAWQGTDVILGFRGTWGRATSRGGKPHSLDPEG